MIERRSFLALGMGTMAGLFAGSVRAAEAVQPVMNDDGLYTQEWFLQSFLDLGGSRPLAFADIDVGGVSQATLNMDVGSTMTGSVSTGQGTGASVLYYYGTNVNVDVTSDWLSRVIRLGGTRP